MPLAAARPGAAVPSPRTPLALPVPHRVHARLAAWADSRLLPVVVVGLLLVDIGLGLNWLGSPPERLQAAAYTVAKQVAPMPVHGAVFTAAVALAVLAAVVRGRSWLTGWLVGGLLAGLWFFWTVMFGLAPIGTQGASYAGVSIAAPMCLLHVVAGLALTHRPGASTDRRA